MTCKHWPSCPTACIDCAADLLTPEPYLQAGIPELLSAEDLASPDCELDEQPTVELIEPVAVVEAPESDE